MNSKTLLFFIVFVLAMLIQGVAQAQLSAPGRAGSDKTSYPVFNGTDSIYIFCAQAEGQSIAALRGNTGWTGTKTFLWEKYNNVSSEFELYFSESTASQTSLIDGLDDGCYRLTITQAENTFIERAWVFNNWYTSVADISESNCDWFRLKGEYTSADLKYYDLANNTEIDVNKNIRIQWKTGQDVIAVVINPQVFNPPPRNTDYTFVVYDNFGCQSASTVTYYSIVTKADFSIDKENGEAPLTVAFTNNSENGTPGQYEWFFFRDLDDIKRDSEGSSTPVDSIEVLAYDDNPVYIYEYSGTYMVKLVSKKITGQQVCVDTVYLKDYIVADTSFIAAPNVFTPNGDGTNDEFVVKFWSMESIEINIFNRWGKRVHHWESGNVRGFEGTWTETVWDGRGMGGRYASPGVYYFVAEGKGRDGEKRNAKGFVHLFRDKD